MGVLLWSIGMSLKEDPIVEASEAAVQLGFGTGFTLLVYHLFSMAGSTGVLLWVLRIVYSVWLLFSVLLIVQLIKTFLLTQKTLDKYLEDVEEQAEDKDADDDEERPRKKRPSRDEEDDEDEDEDNYADDDEDEEEEEKPRRKRRPSRDEDEDDDD
jgi:hypothetical protein